MATEPVRIGEYNHRLARMERLLAMAEFSIEQFEGSRHENGDCYWYAHEFMESLGYQTWQAAQPVIQRAMGSCTKIDIDPTEAFSRETIFADGKPFVTYRLTRFACFLLAMHADSKKPQVAKAKAALAAIADILIQAKVQENDLGRLEARDDLKLAERQSGGVAQDAGLRGDDFAIFKNAGFLGMYNMSIRELVKHKGVTEPNAVLYDYMGLDELAGNLFRVTQTTARIKTKALKGLTPLSQTAKQVGIEVRNLMLKNSGVNRPGFRRHL
jgi:DNA-damage-inducible protein D